MILPHMLGPQSPAFIAGQNAYIKWASLTVPDAAPACPYFDKTHDAHDWQCGWQLENNDLFDVIAAAHRASH